LVHIVTTIKVSEPVVDFIHIYGPKYKCVRSRLHVVGSFCGRRKTFR